MMMVIVSYDVNTETASGKKRLRNVAKICNDYGQRVQNSVFECLVDSTKLEEMKERLLKVYDEECDSLYFFNVGKKDKISRGDIVGFLIHKGALSPAEIGRIELADHHAYVAVPADKLRQTALALSPHKIKNTRVRVTQLK